MSINIQASLIVDYERALMGVISRVPNFYFQGNKNFKESNVITLVRYAFKNILRFNSEESLLACNENLLKSLGLINLVKYIDFPYGLNQKSYFYLIFRAFPEEYYKNKEQFVLYIYKNVIRKKMHTPPYFYDGEEGRENAAYCLMYCFNNTGFDIKEGYKFFSSPQGRKFLKENKLFCPIGKIYKTPLDFFHYSLPEDDRSELLYHFYKFSSNFTKKDLLEVISA